MSKHRSVSVKFKRVCGADRTRDIETVLVLKTTSVTAVIAAVIEVLGNWTRTKPRHVIAPGGSYDLVAFHVDVPGSAKDEFSVYICEDVDAGTFKPTLVSDVLAAVQTAFQRFLEARASAVNPQVAA